MEKVDQAIANVISNTLRKKRQDNIINIANSIKLLKQEIGNIEKVASLVGISSNMLGQFLKVDKLSEKCYDLVKRNVISSVAVVNNLSKFSVFDQDVLVEEIINERLNSNDLKLLSPLRKQFTNRNILDLILILKESENKKISVIKYDAIASKKNLAELRSDLVNIIGDENLISISLEDNTGVVKFSKHGESLLRKEAQKSKISLADFFFKLN